MKLDKILCCSFIFSGKSEIVSEQDFVDKVLRRLKGQGGITLNSFLQNDVELEAYNNSSFIVKVMSLAL